MRIDIMPTTSGTQGDIGRQDTENQAKSPDGKHQPMPALDADRLTWALWYAQRLGWPVHPLHAIRPDGTCSCGQPNDAPGHKPGKHPRLGAWQVQATTDPEQI